MALLVLRLTFTLFFSAVFFGYFYSLIQNRASFILNGHILVIKVATTIGISLAIYTRNEELFLITFLGLFYLPVSTIMSLACIHRFSRFGSPADITNQNKLKG